MKKKLPAFLILAIISLVAALALALTNSLTEMNEIIKLENIQATEEQKQAVARINGCDDPEHLVSRYGEEQAEKMYGMYAGIFFLIENAVK
ncbi:MAG: hypothetical protein IIX07_00330 [Lachnospiraceae bacterium]|nr:hypothetical protein [Lachnospiraceae bacterium]